MVEIKITGGTAIIDDDDVVKVTSHYWHTNKDGYAVTNIWLDGKRTSVSMHRLVMGCMPKDGKELDHINRIRLDNRKENLRFVPHKFNTWNCKGKKNVSSKYKGITKNRSGGYSAVICVSGKNMVLGSRKIEEEAARLYDIAATMFYKEYAHLNFPDNPPTEQEMKDLQEFLENPLSARNTSGYLGVSYHSTRKWWIGSIVVNKKTYKLTPCKTALEAAIARDKKAYFLLGDKAKLNFPERVEEYKEDVNG